jgi:hypothetical protein
MLSRLRDSEAKMTDAYKALIESYDSEEGYPSKEWIEKFHALPPGSIKPDEADDFLINQLPGIAKTISCMQVIISDAKDDYSDRPLKRVEYITGGWSGAEDLIEVMLSQFWINHRHSLWKRGGYYVFEVPAPALAETNGERQCP